MNLEESDKFAQQQVQNEQRKKFVMVGIVLCAILAALLVILIIYIQYQDSLKLKVFLDGTQISFSGNMFKDVDGTKYVNVKEMSDLLNYTYTKGEYKKYNENDDSCYIKNNLEVVAITAEDEIFTKYIQVVEGAPELTPEGPYGIEMRVESQNDESNTFVLEHPIKQIDGQLYIPFESLTDVYNVMVNTSEKNRIRMYTLPSLFQTGLQIATQLEYSTISGVYENIRALAYGLVVVGNNGIFGVVDMNANEILSVKYENLEFLQNAQEFFIRAENTVGLLDKEGNTIIQPMDYDDMSILDQIEELYLVEKDHKYGVLNREGEVVLHVDYDRIGLKNIEDFKLTGLRNNFLLFDKCIVAEMDEGLGLYDLKGEELLKPVYQGFGYVSDVSGEDSVLMVYKEDVGMNGLVINFDGRYAIYDVDKKAIAIPAVYTKIYSVTKGGKTTYYAEFNEEQRELKDIIKEIQAASEAESQTQTSQPQVQQPEQQPVQQDPEPNVDSGNSGDSEIAEEQNPEDSGSVEDNSGDSGDSEVIIEE